MKSALLTDNSTLELRISGSGVKEPLFHPVLAIDLIDRGRSDILPESQAS
jgi:hypothetical protein